MNRLLRCLALTLCTLLSLAGAASAEGRMIIVMDGSGSMWGQIDGRAKLAIARDTVAEVLGSLPADRELGLLAYGHREKGNCGDIELIVPPEKNTSAAILSAVQAMRFLGKTPLTAAVQQAAEALRYTEEEATVVLVTDGLETCEADPCALGTELAQLGLKFTTHVVGFGLTKEEGAAVACLADNTGGSYIAAASAKDLLGALQATVSAVPQADTAALPKAALTAPDEAPIGTEIAVGWSVSDSAELDTITIGAADGDDHSAYVYASSGNPVTRPLGRWLRSRNTGSAPTRHMTMCRSADRVRTAMKPLITSRAIIRSRCACPMSRDAMSWSICSMTAKRLPRARSRSCPKERQ